jgi:hypothetical protein
MHLGDDSGGAGSVANRTGVTRMSRWSGLRSAAMLSVAVLCGACTAAQPSGSVAVATATVTTATPSADASAETAIPATLAPTETAVPTSSSLEPPAASLAAEGGDPVAGRLGSFTWAGGGSDSPWLPGAPLRVGTREPLSLTLADGVRVAQWTAARKLAGSSDRTAAVELGHGTDVVRFGAPGPGTWSVQVAVRFAGGLGSAAYYWELSVR